MLLLSTSMAFRGDNTRNILWSDIFLRDIPLVEVGLDFKVPVSCKFYYFYGGLINFINPGACCLLKPGKGKLNWSGR
jgi:hypothetical protein